MPGNPRISSYEYFDQLRAVEEWHWWSRGMRIISDAMLAPYVGDRRNLDILDAGCGSGISLSWLRRYSQPKDVIGIDISEHALEFSRGRGHKEVSLGSVTKLNFEDEKFDLVVCNDVLQHVNDDEKALGEFYRVLKYGGCLLVRTNSKFGINRKKESDSIDYRMYTREELLDKLERANFHTEQMTHVNSLMSIVPVVKRYFREKKELRYDDRGLHIRLLPRHFEWLNQPLEMLLQVEARFLSIPSRSIPFGNTIMFLAKKI